MSGGAPAAPKRAPEPAFYDDPVIDQLIAVTMELGAELWQQKERTRALERVLAERGLVAQELIDAWQPSDEDAARAKAERDAFVERVYGAFVRQTVPATPPSRP